MQTTPVFSIFATICTLTASTTLLTPASYANESPNQGERETTPPPSTSNLPSLGKAAPTKSNWKGAEVDINNLDRASDGNYASLTWTITNNSNSSISLTDMRNSTFLYGKASTGSGVILIDEGKDIRYHPLVDSEGDCICAGADYSPGKFVLQTEPGASTTYWASYQLSEDTETVTVEIPGFLPIKDVPVG